MSVDVRLDIMTAIKRKKITFVALLENCEIVLNKSMNIINGSRKTISDFIVKLAANKNESRDVGKNGLKTARIEREINKKNGMFLNISARYLKNLR
jgi:hypothetical protein